MDKETSSRVSTIAAKYIDFDTNRLIEAATPVDDQFIADVRTLAASCMSQDQTPGQQPKTYLDRLKDERDELRNRYIKLKAFLTDGAPGVPPHHIDMLENQRIYMGEYLSILDTRYADLKNAERATVASETEKAK